MSVSRIEALDPAIWTRVDISHMGVPSFWAFYLAVRYLDADGDQYYKSIYADGLMLDYDDWHGAQDDIVGRLDARCSDLYQRHNRGQLHTHTIQPDRWNADGMYLKAHHLGSRYQQLIVDGLDRTAKERGWPNSYNATYADIVLRWKDIPECYTKAWMLGQVLLSSC